MSQNPINLGLRFLLEIAALVALGNWGSLQAQGFMKYGLMIGVPLLAAIVWGTFRVPGDPGSAPVAVPGVVRLFLEVAFFGFAIWTLFSVQAVNLAMIFGVVVMLHYLVSYDRILSLLKR